MNAYDLAHGLARALAESDEYREFVEAKKKLDSNPTASKMLLDFRHRQLQLQTRQLTGQKIGDEELNQLRRLAEIIDMHADVRTFEAAEQRFGQLFSDVQRIQGESIEEWYKFADQVTESLLADAAKPDADRSAGDKPAED